MFGGVGVAEEGWEVYGSVGELGVGLEDALCIGVGDDAGVVLDDFDPFGFWAEDDAGSFKEEGFFLDATTVGHHEECVLLEERHFEEREWVEEVDEGLGDEECAVGVGEFAASAWMKWEDDGDLFVASDLDECCEYCVESLWEM